MIYLAQDARGTEAIDQWNIRHHHQIIAKHAPPKRVLRFQNLTRSRSTRGADIMGSIRLMVALILMASSMAACATTRCPATNGGHSLSDVELFDGPPSELASLVPGNGGWKLDYKAAAPDGHFYLGYRYAADATPLAIKLPPTISNCRIKKYPRLSCR